MFIDLHTHHATHTPHTISIIDCGTTPPTDSTPCSVGIHPWHIPPAWEHCMEQISRAAQAKNVVAIGECGIDKLNSPATPALQTEILAAHATLAEEAQKPLILHCVKGQEEIIGLHRKMAAKQAWIIHGFRGKPTQAEQLLREGFFLSFGAVFNPRSLAITPADRLFIESDTSNTPIEDIYKVAALCRGVSTEELAATIASNIKLCNIAIF